MNDSGEILQIIKPAIRGFPIIIICAIAAGVAAYQSAKYKVPLYEATSVIKIDSREFGVSNTNFFKDFDFFSSSNQLETEIELIESTYLIKKAIKNLDFGISYCRVGKLRTSEIYHQTPFVVQSAHIDSTLFDSLFYLEASDTVNYTLSYPYHGDIITIRAKFGTLLENKGIRFTIKKSAYFRQNPQALLGKFSFRFNSIETQVKDITQQEFFAKALEEDVPVVRITVRHEVAKKAQKFVNAIAEAYIQEQIFAKNQAAVIAENFISLQLDSIQRELRQAEFAIEHYKRQHKIIDTKQEIDGGLKKISQLEMQKTALDIEEAEIDQLKRYIMLNKDLSNFAPNYEIISDPLFGEKLQQLSSLLTQRKELLLTYEPTHPKVLTVSIKINDHKEYILESITNTRKNIDARRFELEQDIEEAHRALDNLPTYQRSLIDLERTFRLHEKTYSYLLEKKTEASIAKSAHVSFHRVLETAQISKTPVSPNKTFLTIVSVFLGGLSGLLLVFTKYYFSPKVETRGQIEKNSAIKFLNVIRKYEDKYKGAFNALTTNLYLLGKWQPIKTICITSTVWKEGKSFVATHLAQKMAAAGKATLLIDIKEENTTQDSFTKIDAYLTKRSCHIQDEKSITTLEEFIEKEKPAFDHIIIDGMPVGREVSMLPVMQLADINLYVMRARFTSTHFISNPDLVREEYKIENLFIVLNEVKPSFGFNGYFEGKAFRSIPTRGFVANQWLRIFHTASRHVKAKFKLYIAGK